eukprot:446779-Hanusia_phi.AAC.1
MKRETEVKNGSRTMLANYALSAFNASKILSAHHSPHTPDLNASDETNLTRLADVTSQEQGNRAERSSSFFCRETSDNFSSVSSAPPANLSSSPACTSPSLSCCDLAEETPRQVVNGTGEDMLALVKATLNHGSVTGAGEDNERRRDEEMMKSEIDMLRKQLEHERAERRMLEDVADSTRANMKDQMLNYEHIVSYHPLA